MNFLVGIRIGEMRLIGLNVDEVELRICCFVNFMLGGMIIVFCGNCNVFFLGFYIMFNRLV